MSFGFSVSDFVTVIKLVNDACADFRSAAAEFRQVSKELECFRDALNDVSKLLAARDLTRAQQESLGNIQVVCLQILEDGQRLMDKYQHTLGQRSIDSGAWETRKWFRARLKLSRGTLTRSSILDPGEVGVRNGVRRAWKRLQWKYDDVCRLRGRIVSAAIRLNSIIEMINNENVVLLIKGQEIQEKQEQKRAQEEQKRYQEKIFHWLTPFDYFSQQSDFIRRRQPGTGQWLLDSTEYRHWLSTKRETLFCPGIPGAGKTILASIVIENLLDLNSIDESVGICYIFLSTRRSHEQDLSHLMASLLKQLLQAKSTCLEKISLPYDRHKKNRTRPSLDELRGMLHSVASGFARIFVVVDALDECQIGDDDCRSRFISELLDLCSVAGVNILATSRPIPEITAKFDRAGAAVKEICASDDDIVKYLDEKLSTFPSFVSCDPLLQVTIKETIVERVKGMFLLAQLHLDSLRDKTTRKAVRIGLSRLGRDSTYDAAYRDAVARIQDQRRGHADLALQALAWITFAKRPLTATELQNALGVELNTKCFDEENLPDIEDVVSYCSGLVTVDEESGIIRLVHYTAHEYLEQTGGWFPNPHYRIAEICVTYLAFDIFGDGACKSPPELDTRLSTYPLYNYASIYWGDHAYLASNYEFCYPFLSMTPNVSACSQVLFQNEHLRNYGRRGSYNIYGSISSQVTGLHLAAYFGLEQAVRSHAESRKIDGLDSYGRTPMLYAIRNGHATVVGALLEKCVMVDSQVNKMTLLSHASVQGHEAIVRVLLMHGANVEARDNYGRTPLSYAAMPLDRNKGVVELLLESGARIESKDHYGRTPLSRAVTSWEQDQDVIHLLLESGADIESIDNNGRTPLSHAVTSWDQNQDVVRLLIENGANIGSKDDRGRTPLFHAITFGRLNEDIIRLLIGDGANIETKESNECTPVSLAHTKGENSLVRTLLAEGAVV
ncbi:hypothetical protein F4777DRAFT_222673 [Nemania sp. FL0916]|nr:hypothetical protein F4777DRAFT_222673 [Nemania sp. FL0916]